jgi:hypothetical protein
MQRVVKWSGQVKWANMTIRKPLKLANQCSPHLYEVLPRSDKRGVDLISDVLPFGRLWYVEVSDAIEYAKHRSRSHDAVIHVCDDASNVIETHEHAGDFQEL